MIIINSSPRSPLGIFQPLSPLFVPIGIGYLLASAERRNIPVHFVDEQIEKNIQKRIDACVGAMPKPAIFAFGVLTAVFKNAVDLASVLKKRYPDSFVVFGGIHPTACPEEVLAYPQVDAVLRGEGECSLMELYRCVKEHRNFTHIAGLSYRREGRVASNPIEIVGGDDAFAPFPYHRFPRPYDVGFIVTSRGCPYQCIFCSNRLTTGLKYRFREPAASVEELERLLVDFHQRYVIFLDDNFCVSRPRIHALIDEIKKRGLHRKMSFSFQGRADSVDEPLMRELYDAGFHSVSFGIETASEKIMKGIKKGETVAECVSALKMAKRLGYCTSSVFIFGLPEETFQDRMAAVELSDDLDLDMVRYNNATPYPGTELWEIAKRQGRIFIKGLYENFISVAGFVENPFRPIRFPYVPPGNTEAEIRRDMLYAYFRFYIHRARFMRMFKKQDEGPRWFETGNNLSEKLKKLLPLIVVFCALLVKFSQFFIYTVLYPPTRISLNHFLTVFKGLGPSAKKGPAKEQG
jgi:anaerobic magnesium-protoporphyrin IX monomethyl ester cyclase